MNQPLVSIVTPVHNEAGYLPECIESVLAQTYQNWDYTIVNNCSTDSSAEIARQYAARDPRIRVRDNQEFAPIIANHNIAFRQISPTSKYCKVVFADDWIFPECLDRMVAVAEDHPSVGIVGAYGVQGNTVLWTGLPYPSKLVPGREVGHRHFVDPSFKFGSASSMLFRADVVRSHEAFYNEANLHADIEACIVVLKTYDFGFVNQVLCFSRERDCSTSSRASEMTTYKASFLQHLVKYGPAFLTAKEFDTCLTQTMGDYYNFFALNLLFDRDSKIREYHKNSLAENGIGLSRARLARAIAVRLCRAGLNPLETIEKLLNKFRGNSTLEAGGRNY